MKSRWDLTAVCLGLLCACPVAVSGEACLSARLEEAQGGGSAPHLHFISLFLVSFFSSLQ